MINALATADATTPLCYPYDASRGGRKDEIEGS
jgi:hypothetical protein